MTDMRTSAHGRMLIEQREGFRGKAYRDSVGVLTIGYGHTGRASSPAVVQGMTCTKAEADLWLSQDLAAVEHGIDAALHYQPTQNQFDALVSLAHNIGLTGFLHSTVLHLINANNPHGAADAFLMWDKATDASTKRMVVLKGLVNRRQAERLQFLTPDSANVAAPATPAPKITPPPPAIPATLAPPGFWERGGRALAYWFFDIDLVEK